jgi:DNA polymerase-3 subunit delta'
LGTALLSDLLVQRHQFAPEQAQLIASLSEGCPGRALSMDTEAALEKRNLVQQLLNTLSSGLQDVRVIFTQVETLLEDKNLIQEFLDMILMWYRDMYFLQEEADSRLLANADAIPALRQGAVGLTLRQIRHLFEIVYQTKLDILRNANLQLALEVMLISLVEVYNDRNHWR